ncbi:MAG: UDP-N-acetylmuramate dehydrogenase [Alphaproteobacteria bacterium]|nr:UDP-N-acetylmuramate dehydrogenase [Alphaproteobacteria bacterium]
MFEKLFGNKSSGLIEVLPEVRGKYIENALLSKHTWFGVGGPAEVLYLPEDEDDLRDFLLRKPEAVPVTVIGGGSNLLIRDGGMPGVVIKLDGAFFRKIEVLEDKQVCVGAGLNNVELKKTLLENNIGGLEFICSVPGRIGGLLKTNAGCFGRTVADVMVSARIMNDWGEVYEMTAEDFNFSYRSSCFPENWIILSVVLKGVTADKEKIKKIMDEQMAYRKEKQPINKKTAGSTFKNPEGLAAWKLIDEAGCRGLKVGGAEVSDKHCNFLINSGNATAEDLEKLGETIIERVKEKTAVTLEWEVRRMGVKK